MCWSAASSCFTLGPSVLAMWPRKYSNRPESSLRNTATLKLTNDTARPSAHELSRTWKNHANFKMTDTFQLCSYTSTDSDLIHVRMKFEWTLPTLRQQNLTLASTVVSYKKDQEVSRELFQTCTCRVTGGHPWSLMPVSPKEKKLL